MMERCFFSDFVSPELVEGHIPNSDFRPRLDNSNFYLRDTSGQPSTTA